MFGGDRPSLTGKSGGALRIRRSLVIHSNVRNRVWQKTPPNDTLSPNDPPKWHDRMPLINFG